MIRGLKRSAMVLVGMGTAWLVCGCHDGVADIVAGSLQLAFGIVEAAG